MNRKNKPEKEMAELHVLDLMKTCKELYEKDTVMADLESVLSRFSEVIITPGSGEKAFIKQHTFSLPPALATMTSNVERQLRMGFLPEIAYVWVAIDAELILIDFSDNRRIIRLSMDAYVDCCIVFTPAPFTFSAETQYLLAVALSNKIKLYLLTYPKLTSTLENTAVVASNMAGTQAIDTNITTKTTLNTKHWDTSPFSKAMAPKQHSFVISESNLDVALPTDSLVTQLVATKKGRFFAGLTNGSLIEVVYTSQNEGLLSHLGLFSAARGALPGGFPSTSAGIGRARLIDHTSMPIISHVPFVSDLLRPKPVKQCVVDDTRDILYTLHEDNRITTYFLGDDGGTAVKRVKPYTTFQKDISMYSNAPRASIVQIWPITKAESITFNLVGMTDSGLELYYSLSVCGIAKETFTLDNEYYADFNTAMGKAESKTVHIYDCAHDKLTLKQVKNTYQHIRSLANASCMSFFRSRGVSIASFLNDVSQQNIICGTVNEVSVQPRVQRCISEILVDVFSGTSGYNTAAGPATHSGQLPQKIIDVVEIDKIHASGLSLSSTHLSSNPQLYQYIHSPRCIAIVTTTAIVVYAISTPLDKLLTLLQNKADCTKQRELYGDVEYYCMLLAASCQNAPPGVADSAALKFLEQSSGTNCIQVSAIKRYMARLLGPLSIYPYWRGAASSAPRAYAIQSGDPVQRKATGMQSLLGFFSRAMHASTGGDGSADTGAAVRKDGDSGAATRDKQRARSAAANRAVIDFSEQGRKAYKEGIITKQNTKRAGSTNNVSTRSIFRSSSTKISTSALTKHLSFQASMPGTHLLLDNSHIMASLTWTAEELSDIRGRINRLLQFLQGEFGKLSAITNALPESERISNIFDSLGSISEAIGFISLITHPTRIVYASKCLNNFARLHGQPMVNPNGHLYPVSSKSKRPDAAGENQAGGIYCDLLSLSGVFSPESRVLLDEIIRTMSVGEVAGMMSFSKIGKSQHSLLRGASLRHGVNCEFTLQLKEQCQILYNVYNVRIQILQQLEQAKQQPPDRRNVTIRNVLELLFQSRSSIEPIEPILNAMKELGNYSACIVLLLLQVSPDDALLMDALCDDGKLADIKGSLGIHVEHNVGPATGAYGNRGRTYNLVGPQGGTQQASPTLEGSLKPVFSKVLQSNINHACDYYKECCYKTVGQGSFIRFKELQESIDAGTVRFPFKVDNAFEALTHNELFMSNITRKDWCASLMKVCASCSKALEIVSQGYLLAGIYELLSTQGSTMTSTNRSGDFTKAGFSHFGGYSYFSRQSGYGEGAGELEPGHHDGDNLFSLTGVPLRSIHTAASAATWSASGQIITVLRTAITQCSSKAWQLQLYYFLYAHYYTSACILKALQEGEVNYDVSIPVVTTLKIIENRASLGLIMAVSPHIEGFLKAQNFYLYFRFLEKRAYVGKACVAMFRKATEEKTQALFPSMVNGVVQLGYLTLQDRINMLSDALAKLESGGAAHIGSAQTAYKTVINAPLLGAEYQSYGGVDRTTTISGGGGGMVGYDADMARLSGVGNPASKNVYMMSEMARMEEQQVDPQKLLVSIRETLTSARVQLVILRRIKNVKDTDTSKYITQLDTEGIKMLQELYKHYIVPLHLSDIAIYTLLSSATPNQERQILGNYWVAALTNTSLPGFTFKQETLLNDPHRGVTRGIVHVENLSSLDLEAGNIIGQAAQVFRSIVEMCTELSLTSFDYIVPMTIFALLITNKYKTYDVQQPYEKLTAQFILNLFTSDMITINEKSLVVHLIHSVESIWKVLAPYQHQGNMSTTGNQLDTATIMESIPVSDLLKEDLSYVSKVLCYYIVALIKRYTELRALGYDPSQASINKKNIGMRIRALLPQNAPIMAQLDRLCM